MRRADFSVDTRVSYDMVIGHRPPTIIEFNFINRSVDKIEWLLWIKNHQDMSKSVQRAQRRVNKIKAILARAEAEVERQIQLDVERQARKAEIAKRKAELAAEKKKARALAKAERDATKPERDAAKRAAIQADYEAHPEKLRSELFRLLMSLCMDDNLKCNAATVDAYLAWKSTKTFPPKTNRYQKCEQFIRETIMPLDEQPGIPVYAKTMTGDLIPLLYHPTRDSRDLLIQLEAFSPDEFPVGSTILARIYDDEDQKEPVKEGDLFGLFRHGATLVSYEPTYARDDVNLSSDGAVSIRYYLFVNKNGLINPRNPDLLMDHRITLYYFPEDQTIATQWDTTRRSISDWRDLLRSLTVYQYLVHESIALTDQAQEEIMAVFEAIRRDRRF